MTNPNGTMTRDEIRSDILRRMQAHIQSGLPPADAMDRAGAEFHADLKQKWDVNLAQVETFLRGGKCDA